MNFILFVLGAPFAIVYVLRKAPFGGIFGAFMFKWYTFIFGLCALIVYTTMTGLEQSGFLGDLGYEFRKVAFEVKAVATRCPPLIKQPQAMYQCIIQDYTAEFMAEEMRRKQEEKNNNSKPLIAPPNPLYQDEWEDDPDSDA